MVKLCYSTFNAMYIIFNKQTNNSIYYIHCRHIPIPPQVQTMLWEGAIVAANEVFVEG